MKKTRKRTWTALTRRLLALALAAAMLIIPIQFPEAAHAVETGQMQQQTHTTLYGDGFANDKAVTYKWNVNMNRGNSAVVADGVLTTTMVKEMTSGSNMIYLNALVADATDPTKTVDASSSWTDYSIEADIQRNTDTSAGAFLIGRVTPVYKADGSFLGYSYYMLKVHSTSIYLLKRYYNTETGKMVDNGIAKSIGGTAGEGNWGHAKMTFEGSKITVSLTYDNNGTPKTITLSYTDDGEKFGAVLTSGGVGLRTDAASVWKDTDGDGKNEQFVYDWTALFDNVKATMADGTVAFSDDFSDDRHITGTTYQWEDETNVVKDANYKWTVTLGNGNSVELVEKAAGSGDYRLKFASAAASNATNFAYLNVTDDEGNDLSKDWVNYTLEGEVSRESVKEFLKNTDGSFATDDDGNYIVDTTKKNGFSYDCDLFGRAIDDKHFYALKYRGTALYLLKYYQNEKEKLSYVSLGDISLANLSLPDGGLSEATIKVWAKFEGNEISWGAEYDGKTVQRAEPVVDTGVHKIKVNNVETTLNLPVYTYGGIGIYTTNSSADKDGKSDYFDNIKVTMKDGTVAYNETFTPSSATQTATEYLGTTKTVTKGFVPYVADDWSVSDGIYASNGIHQSISVIDVQNGNTDLDQNWSNYMVEADITLQANRDRGGLVAYYSDAKHYYELRVFGDGEMALIQHDGGMIRTLADKSVGQEISGEVTYKAKLEVYGTKLTGYLYNASGTPINTISHDFAEDESNNKNPHTSGTAGLISGENAKYDNFSVTTHVWEYDWDENNHWLDCTVCGADVDEEAHNGGTATCVAAKVCTDCRQPYGEKDAANHTTEEPVWTRTETTHKKAWSCCGLGVVAEELHEWNGDNVCDECFYDCTDHQGGEATCLEKAKCEFCGTPYGEKDPENHVNEEDEWTSGVIVHEKKWECCGEVTIAEELHRYVNGVCYKCGWRCAHYNGTPTCTEGGKCVLCGVEYIEETNPENHTGEAKWTKTAEKHSKAYECCGAVVVAEEKHEWKDGVCTECGYGCGHTGGTATCTAKAVCTVCGEAYGEKNAENHTGEAKWTKTAEKHSKAYDDCCGAVVVEEEVHEWKDGKCSECGYECKHTGGEATCLAAKVCTICGESYGQKNAENHTGETKWIKTATKHEQVWSCCDAVVVAEEVHEWKNGQCTECGYGCGHTGGEATCTAAKVCVFCGASYGEKNPANHAGEAKWTQTAEKHSKAYECCGVVVVEEEVHEWKSGKCSECGYACGHTGGTATCTAKAVCTVCGEAYGEKNAENHTGEAKWAQTAEKHSKAYDCCGAVVVEEEVHEWKDGKCSECGYECKHTGGEATCLAAKVCTICGESYGEKNAENHTGEAKWSQSEVAHKKAYNCCGAVVVVEEVHEWKDGKCSECGYECKHTGGKATCVNKAECIVCGEAYGELDADNHTTEAKWTQTVTVHQKAYECCGAVVVEEEKHEWKDGVCAECGYECEHAGGEATCVDKAACVICGESYGELNAENHAGEAKWAQTAEKHSKAYDCCGVVVVAEEVHEWKNGKCGECGYACVHTGGTATCTAKAVCSVCGEAYGELNAENHTGEAKWVCSADKHAKAYACCGAAASAEEAHDWKAGKCSECGYECKHTGGTATCKDKAVCSACGEAYGELNAENHTGKAEWTKTADKHSKAYDCCGTVVVAEEAHTMVGNKCEECGDVPNGTPATGDNSNTILYAVLMAMSALCVIVLLLPGIRKKLTRK